VGSAIDIAYVKWDMRLCTLERVNCVMGRKVYINNSISLSKVIQLLTKGSGPSPYLIPSSVLNTQLVKLIPASISNSFNLAMACDCACVREVKW